MRGMHHRRVDHHVVVEELGGPCGIRQDTADGPCHEKDVLRTVRTEPVFHGGLIAKIQLVPCRRQQLIEPSTAQPARDGRANEATMARDEDSCAWIDVRHWVPLLAAVVWVLPQQMASRLATC